MKKKILIISNYSCNELGGVEGYNLFLIKNLSKYYDFYELFRTKKSSLNKKNFFLKKSFFLNLNFCKFKFFPINLFYIFIKKFFYLYKLKKIIKKNNINIIINSDNEFIINQKKIKIPIINVQHSDVHLIIKKFVEQQNNNFFYKTIHKIRGDYYFYLDNIVCFTIKDKEKLSFFINNRNIFPITTSIFSKEKIKNNIKKYDLTTHNEIAYIGRNSPEKNIKKIENISDIIYKKNNLKITFYGFNKNNCENYKGEINKSEIDKVFKKIKLLILCSKYEGFPLCVIEALSNGVPCVIADSFNNANYLINNKRGIIVSNEDDDNFIANKIIDLYYSKNYKILVKNCFNFSLNNLNSENFLQKWKKLIDNKLK